MGGDAAMRKQHRPTRRGLRQRVLGVTGDQWQVTSAPTATQRAAVEECETLFSALHGEVKAFFEHEYATLLEATAAAKAPWTPMRLPRWSGAKR